MADHCPFSGKIMFESKRDARRRMKSLGRGRAVYRCPACDGWHITSRPASERELRFKAKFRLNETHAARRVFKRLLRQAAEAVG